MIIFLACLTFSSLVILSISMTKHYQEIFNKQLTKKAFNSIRRVGWLLMALTIGLAIYYLDFGVGLATFFGVLSLVGLIHVWLLSYAKHFLIPLAILMPVVSFIFLIAI